MTIKRYIKTAFTLDNFPSKEPFAASEPMSEHEESASELQLSNFEPPKIESWIPPTILANFPLPKDRKFQQDKKTKSGSPAPSSFFDAAKDYATTLKALSSQALLLTERLVNSISEGDVLSDFSRQYLRHIGEVFSRQELKGKIIINDGKAKESSEKIVQKAIRDPKDIWFEDLGRIYLEHGSIDHVFEKVNTFWSNPDSKQLQEAENDIFIYSNCVLQMRDSISELHEQFWEARGRSDRLVSQAVQKSSVEDLAATMEALTEAFEADNKSLEAFQKIYYTLKKAGLDKIQENFFKKESSAYLRKTGGREKLVNFLNAHGSDDHIYDVLKEAHKAEKTNHKFIQNLSVSALKMGRINESIKWCEKLIETAPQNSEGYNLMGICYKKRKDFKKAIHWYLQGIDADPKCGKLYHNLAIAYALIGDKKKSSDIFQKAARFKVAALKQKKVS